MKFKLKTTTHKGQDAKTGQMRTYTVPAYTLVRMDNSRGQQVPVEMSSVEFIGRVTDRGEGFDIRGQEHKLVPVDAEAEAYMAERYGYKLDNETTTDAVVTSPENRAINEAPRKRGRPPKATTTTTE